MSKQTAVEWLVNEYEKAFKISVNAVMSETIEQAKAMEKEQMIKFCQTWEDGTIEDTKTDLYNSIYGGDK
jgi:hypothetical protein